MTIQDFVDLVSDLNESLEGNSYMENEGLCFNYRSRHYCDAILFGEYPVFCSENDSRYDFENDIEISIKQIVTNNFNKYREALNTVEL